MTKEDTKRVTRDLRRQFEYYAKMAAREDLPDEVRGMYRDARDSFSMRLATLRHNEMLKVRA